MTPSGPSPQILPHAAPAFLPSGPQASAATIHWPIDVTTRTHGRQQLSGPTTSPQQTIQITGTPVTRWQKGAYQATQWRHVQVIQGANRYQAREAVIWINPQAPVAHSPGSAVASGDLTSDLLSGQGTRHVAILYLEGDVAIRFGGAESADTAASGTVKDVRWLGTLASNYPVQFSSQQFSADTTLEDLAIQQRAEAYWEQQAGSTAIQTVGFQTQGLDGSAAARVPAALGSPQLAYPSMGNGSTSSATIDPAIPQDLPGEPATLPEPDPSAVFGTLPPDQSDGTYSPNSAGVGSSAIQRDAGQPVRVQIFSRTSGVDPNVRNVPGRIPGEQIILATGGLKVVIDSQQLADVPGSLPGERLVIQADNLVAWTNQIQALGGSASEPRWELFLEGNVIFALGQRVVYANKMYYDVNRQSGTILDAEMLSPVPDQYRGLIRLRADVLQQVNQQQFRAYGAAVTTSRIGEPRYWLESRELDLTRTRSFDVDPLTGAAALDPETYQPEVKDQFKIESYDNFINVLGTPILYWPLLKTSLDQPEYYLQNFAIKNDNIFGTQVLSDWNMYQVLGWEPMEGTQWTGALDYLSERGIGLGSQFTYQRDTGFVFPGITNGYYDSWFLWEDSGLDNLGLDRRKVPLEETRRGRTVWRHDHRFLNGDRLLGEFGWISDRNFLEQFYEREWDEQKDQATRVRYQRQRENRLFEISAAANVNDFFTQTQWLPRLDSYVIGQSVLGSRVTWHQHSHIGYADLKVGDAPTNAVDLAKYDPLAWEAEREGLRMGTRQELEVPAQLGPVKVVPYVLGDATYWGEDLTGNELTRLYGQTGVRASMPMWRVDPAVQSQLLNLNGLAHKVNFETDVLYADASQDLDQLPLYDSLDDDAQEHFRRRFAFDTFGILPGQDVPLMFDERYFAMRSGLQRYVSSPSAEVADDLMLMKFGINQRWQTKRGTPGREHVIDWITFDVAAHYFPESDRDNFGEDIGMIDYDFRWHIGDRLSLLSDGYFDTFQDGLNTASVGLAANRPEVGDVYLGVRAIDGPISSQTLNARINYRMSHKWIFRASSSWDFGNTGRIGQTIGVVHIGESFVWHVGTNADFSRDNVGFIFGIEPRALPRGRLARLGGVTVPPPGLRGVE